MSHPNTPVALITGGTAGLGLILARHFLQAGYHVVITARDQDRLTHVAGELGDAFPTRKVVGVAADVTNAQACEHLAKEISHQLQRLDTLVNCVGTSDRGLLKELSAERLRELFDQNVVGTLVCSQAMIPLLEQSRGSIVNVGSLAGRVGARFLGGYVAAKHAVAGMTQQMRLELRDKNIHVALVSPGPIRRDDAGQRYSDASQSVPESARQPGGGTKVKGLDPNRVAKAVLLAAQRRRIDVVLPGYLRVLITLGNAFPRLGDWLLMKFT